MNRFGAQVWLLTLASATIPLGASLAHADLRRWRSSWRSAWSGCTAAVSRGQ